MKKILPLAVLFGSLSVVTYADELPDPTSILERVSKEKVVLPAKRTANATAPSTLRADLEDFRNKVATLKPEDSAAQWLKLFDRQGEGLTGELSHEFQSMIQNQRYGQVEDVRAEELNAKGIPVSGREVLLVLPPPEHWPALSAAIQARAAKKPAVEKSKEEKSAAEDASETAANIAKRHENRFNGNANLSPDDFETNNEPSFSRDQALLLLGAILVRNEKHPPQIADLIEQLKEQSANDQYGNDEATALLRALTGQGESNEEILARFEKQVENNNVEQYDIPDLVKLGGEEKAKSILVQILKTTKTPIQSVAGKETNELTQKLVLAHVEDLRAPQWQLVGPTSAPELFEKMDKKFPEDAKAKKKSGLFGRLFGSRSSDDYEKEMQAALRQQAVANYLLSLTIADRKDDADTYIDKLIEPGDKALDKGTVKDLVRQIAMGSANSELNEEQRGKVMVFLQALASKHPKYVDQPLLAAIAARASGGGANDTAVPAPGGDDPFGKTADRPEEDEVTKKLKADQTDEAIAAIGGSLEKSKPGESRNSKRLEEATKLVMLGELLKKQDLLDKGLKLAIAELKLPQTSEDARNSSSDGDEILKVLIDRKRFAEAVELVTIAMQQDKALVEKEQSPGSFSRYHLNNAMEPHVIHLIGIYHDAGKHQQVLDLLQVSPYWDEADLLDLSGYDCRSRHVKFLVASSLAALGKNDQALKILETFIYDRQGYDPAYELLLRLVPDKKAAIAKLDAIYATDKFEERPLIWKAKLLLELGQLDEAEAVARQAITIDPSDGEQPRGDRMRVYAVLSDILAAQGEKEDAELYKNVVKAIRLSEDADQFQNAGLEKRAIEMYQQSLKLFQDAYCIQSRLALKLAEAGRFNEAEPHYRKAFELMPDSFGRMESHCFGCEGAFSGEIAQAIAEEVFTRLIKKTPEKPQLHYLLGYLRSQQDRHAEALTSYKEAVRLDPDYINAWSKISGTPDEVPNAVLERDLASMQLLRLDPLGRHNQVDLSKVTDLALLWKTVDGIKVTRPQPPKSLLVLTAAAKAAADESGRENLNHLVRPSFDSSSSDESTRFKSPAYAILETDAMKQIVQLLNLSSDNSEEN
ncbi:MAG: tetratricopeptide repeat protein [Planctomycetota bacterium]|nr:tetratricopeptide repeat protein [Planctomycetota bacterium]